MMNTKQTATRPTPDSDYLARELNTMIMLNQKSADHLQNKHKHEKDEIFSIDQINQNLAL